MSVRRPARATAANEAGEIPERIRRCTVEDWVSCDEMPPDWWWGGTTINADDPVGETLEWLAIMAWTRWTEAQQEWAKDHGLTWREFCVTYHTGRPGPRWRDWYALRASLIGLGS